MIETVEPVGCSWTRKLVDKAGTAKPDRAVEGLLASPGEATAHLRGHELCLDALLLDDRDGHDIAREVELQELLTACAVFAGAFSIC